MTAAVPATRHTSSIAIIGVLFFIIGFFTWINGPLITFVKLAFDLDEVKAFLVVFVFYISYFVLALPAAWAPCPNAARWRPGPGHGRASGGV